MVNEQKWGGLEIIRKDNELEHALYFNKVFPRNRCVLFIVFLNDKALNSLNSAPFSQQLSGDFTVLMSAHLTARGFTVYKKYFFND